MNADNPNLPEPTAVSDTLTTGDEFVVLVTAN